MAREAAKRLTPKGVLALRKEGYYADSEAVGLYVQVAYRQKGKHEKGEKRGKPKLDKKHGVSRSWVYRFTSPVTKRVRWMGLGSCDVVSLAEARDLAKHARKLVTFGADPIEHRKATEAAKRPSLSPRTGQHQITSGDCVEAYLAEHLDSFRNEERRSGWAKTLGRAAKAFGDLSVGVIDAPMVIKFLTPIWSKTPEGSRIALARPHREGIDWARVHQFRDGDNPARWQGHLEHVFASAKGGSYAAMPYADVPGFMVRLRARDGVSAKALELLILTAAGAAEFAARSGMKSISIRSCGSFPASG